MRTTTTAVLAVGATALAIPTAAARRAGRLGPGPARRAPDRRLSRCGPSTPSSPSSASPARPGGSPTRSPTPATAASRRAPTGAASTTNRPARARPPRARRCAATCAPPRRAERAPRQPRAGRHRLPHARGDRRLRVRRQPGHEHRQRVLRQVPVHALSTWASVGGSGNPAAASEAEQNQPRGAALRARGRLALARLRPLVVSKRMALRDEFPVLERVAYLNAGTDGPIPRAATELVAARARGGARGGPAVAALRAPAWRCRPTCGPGYARLMNCDGGRRRGHDRDELRARRACWPGWTSARATRSSPPTTSTPGLLGPLIAARHRGATVQARCRSRSSPNAVRATTTLVAASHVNWITGEVAPAELAEVQRCR